MLDFYIYQIEGKYIVFKLELSKNLTNTSINGFIKSKTKITFGLFCSDMMYSNKHFLELVSSFVLGNVVGFFKVDK